MEKSRTPLSKWAAAIQAMSLEHSVNAVQLMEEIQVTYKTAWSMLRKLRQAIHAMDERQPLTNKVEAGVGYYEARRLRCFIAHPRIYPVIVGLAYNDNHETIYMKMKPIKPEHYPDFILRYPGEEAFRNRHVRTDRPVKILRNIPFCKHDLLPVLFKQAVHWLNRVFHGVSRRYLESYLDEFCLRRNAKLHRLDPFETIAACSMNIVCKNPAQFDSLSSVA
ncbi:hypothetical protein [Paenibacillus antri]|uniref:hypothetical protein n=1 Tax=Paenibacillus antri TaxID=2582848 RepID=UPI001EE42A8B|nr:hypothetical protein [Paenibacillus antri]